MAKKKKKRGAPQKICPSCGASYHARSKECPDCGATAPPPKSDRRRTAKKKVRTRRTGAPRAAANTGVRGQLRSAAAFLDSVGGDVHQARELLEAVRDLRDKG